MSKVNTNEVFPTVSIHPALEYERLPSLFSEASAPIITAYRNRPRGIFKKKMDQDWMTCMLTSTFHNISSTEASELISVIGTAVKFTAVKFKASASTVESMAREVITVQT